MPRDATAVERTDAPADRPIETLDVRELGPPKPLRRTLELLADLPDETVLLQRNDRAPQFLYPKIEERGYRYDTVEDADAVVTAIWTDPEADEGAADDAEGDDR